MKDIKSRVEAVLFASGRKMNVEEISRVCRLKPAQVEEALITLSKDYDEDEKSLMVVNEGEDWKLTVRERYLSVVRKIVPETELTKTIMETLAVVAWKSPTLQSEIIRIRTNKAYDHLDQLEEMAFIIRKKEGRTKRIILTEKFYKYFDLEGHAGVQKVFKNFKESALKESEERQLMRLDPLPDINLPKKQD